MELVYHFEFRISVFFRLINIYWNTWPLFDVTTCSFLFVSITYVSVFPSESCFITSRYYVVFFLLGNSPASEFYVPTFRYPMKMGQSVPKSRHLKFRRWGIAQKKGQFPSFW